MPGLLVDVDGGEAELDLVVHQALEGDDVVDEPFLEADVQADLGGDGAVLGRQALVPRGASAPE